MEKIPLQEILDNIRDTLTDLSSKTYDSVWDGSSINTDWYTNNTGATTYSVSTASELAGLAQLVNSGTDNFSGKTIVLSASIDLNSMPWTPIGMGDYDGNSNTYNAFYGNFEGNGHFIGNLKIEGDIQYAGLFGYAYNNSGESTCIRNVNLRNANISVNSSGSAYAGGIVGYQSGSGNQTIENCSAEGDVSASGSYPYAGGVVGYQGGGGNVGIKIMNCYFIGNLINPGSSDNSYAGGILGYWGGSDTSGGSRCNFTDCYAAAAFSGFNSSGNLLGYNSNDSQYLIITDCYYDITLAGFNDRTGFGMTTMKMKDKNTYENWDFGYVWKIEPDRYPSLKIFGKRACGCKRC
jgi:hypothetical protein